MNPHEELHERWLDFVFEFANSVGIIWLVDRIPFLELKPWVKQRLSRKEGSDE